MCLLWPHFMFELPFHPHFLCHYSGDLQASRFCHLHCLAPKTAIMHFLCCPYVSFAMLYFFTLFTSVPDSPIQNVVFIQRFFLLQLSDCVCLCHAWHIADLRTHICSMRLCICIALLCFFRFLYLPSANVVRRTNTLLMMIQLLYWSFPWWVSMRLFEEATRDFFSVCLH